MTMLSSLGTKIGTAIKTVKTDLQAAIALKVDSTRVLTDVPVNAKFTDTTYSNATTTVSGLMSETDKVKLDGIQGGTAGKLSGIPMSFHCERASASSVGDKLAFGNGAVSNGVCMPYAGKLVAATLNCSNMTGTVKLQAIKNVVIQSAYELTCTNATATDNHDIKTFSTPLSFSAGDALNWQTIVAASSATCIDVTFYVIFD